MIRLEHGKALLTPDIDAIFRFSSSKENSEIHNGDQIEMFSAGGARNSYKKENCRAKNAHSEKIYGATF